MPAYKQLCMYCKKNYAIIKSRFQKPICLDCEMKYLFEPISDPIFKKMFDIPKKLYEESYFLRDIRRKYNMTGLLSERQVEAFKKAVKDLQDPKKRKEYEEKQKAKEEKQRKKRESLLTPEEKRMLGLE